MTYKEGTAKLCAISDCIGDFPGSPWAAANWHQIKQVAATLIFNTKRGPLGGCRFQRVAFLHQEGAQHTGMSGLLRPFPLVDRSREAAGHIGHLYNGLTTLSFSEKEGKKWLWLSSC